MKRSSTARRQLHKSGSVSPERLQKVTRTALKQGIATITNTDGSLIDLATRAAGMTPRPRRGAAAKAEQEAKEMGSCAHAHSTRRS